jgi:AcrR family transcriptional regulator
VVDVAARPARRSAASGRSEPRRTSRDRIIRAATALFLRRGYSGTTIEAIAHKAGVSVQTIYNVIGSKGAVFKAVYDVTIAGDADPVPMIDRPTARAMLAAITGPECLAYYAQMSREIVQRVGPLLSVAVAEATSGDREIRRFVATVEQERTVGTRNIAMHVQEHFGLRPALTLHEAADILWTLTAPEVADRLLRRRHWTLERYQEWLAGTMADALLPQSSAMPPPANTR